MLQELHDGCSYTDDERAVVSGIAQRVQQQHHQQLQAAAAAVPTSPRTAVAASGGVPPAALGAGEGSAADVPPGAVVEVPATPPASIPAAQADPPTQSQELVGDRASAGRDEFTQDVAMLPATPVGSVLDREPLTPEQAMEERRRRTKK